VSQGKRLLSEGRRLWKHHALLSQSLLALPSSQRNPACSTPARNQAECRYIRLARARLVAQHAEWERLPPRSIYLSRQGHYDCSRTRPLACLSVSKPAARAYSFDTQPVAAACHLLEWAGR
jgi:hypothetical protein